MARVKEFIIGHPKLREWVDGDAQCAKTLSLHNNF
jgi:hypothetical protein